MRKFRPNMKYADAQIRTILKFNKSLERNEHRMHRVPHNHTKSEEQLGIPIDMVIVDAEFSDWFHISFPLFSMKDHVVVLKDEYYQLKILLHQWERKSELERAKWLKAHWSNPFL